jgi:hypothetical protein
MGPYSKVNVSQLLLWSYFYKLVPFSEVVKFTTKPQLCKTKPHLLPPVMIRICLIFSIVPQALRQKQFVLPTFCCCPHRNHRGSIASDLFLVGRSQIIMTPNQHPRNAKRKAESSPPEEESIFSSTRPQRKKRKHSTTTMENSSLSPSASPVTSKPPPSTSAIIKHLSKLYYEIQNATDDTYIFFQFEEC